MILRVLIGLVALGLFAGPAAGEPSVFLRAGPTQPWWNGSIEARILRTSAGTISAKQLSDYVAETILYSPYSVCALEAVTGDTYVGLDKATQDQLEQYRPMTTWRVEALTPDGRKVVGQSVLFESCDAEVRGAALLITDAASNEILRWEIMGDRYDEQGNTHPAWALFLSLKEGDELFSYSGCLECGARTDVYYDVTRKRIYTEYNGH